MKVTHPPVQVQVDVDGKKDLVWVGDREILPDYTGMCHWYGHDLQFPAVRVPMIIGPDLWVCADRCASQVAELLNHEGGLDV